jgi:hypothetical protein
MGKKKTEAAEVAKRVDAVLRIVLDGAQFHDVMQYAEEQKWGLKERQVREYLSRANELLAERLEKNRKRTIARRISQREALFARALNAADYRTALAILSDLDKLQGHYPEKDLRELVRLAAAQGQRIAELEARLALATGQVAPAVPPAGGAAGGTGTGGPWEVGGPAGGVPGGPGEVDG